MSDYREGCIKAKKVKEGIIDLRPVGGKNTHKQKKEFFVLYRLNGKNCFGEPKSASPTKATKWCRWEKYRTKQQAEMVVESLSRKHFFWDFKLEVPDNVL